MYVKTIEKNVFHKYIFSIFTFSSKQYIKIPVPIPIRMGTSTKFCTIKIKPNCIIFSFCSNDLILETSSLINNTRRIDKNMAIFNVNNKEWDQFI